MTELIKYYLFFQCNISLKKENDKKQTSSVEKKMDLTNYACTRGFVGESKHIP